MTLLKEISSSVQQVADAISMALGLEVEIVDECLEIIGGSGTYKLLIGEKEEYGKLDGNMLYARVLRNGKTEYIEDVKKHEDYGPIFNTKKKLSEVAEICAPIKKGNKTIGVIGLIAFDEEQKQILLDKDKNKVSFIEKMAELLSAKAAQQEAFSQAELSRTEMMTILESAHEGIIAIDRGGRIRHCNTHAANLFKTTKGNMAGTHLNAFMMNSPALNIFKTQKGYVEQEERYRLGRGGLHVIVTARPFFNKGEAEGIVISFRDIQEAQQLAYKLEKHSFKQNLEDAIGQSEVIKKLKNKVILASRGDSPVLISGDKGTGKGFIAKAIHYSGTRAEKDFVSVNCSAIPENLLENEILDRFKQAAGGTILFNEIDSMPNVIQLVLLEVLKSTKDGKSLAHNTRIIAATDKDLRAMVKKGEFREDLFYKLNVIPMNIPRLRDRQEDIPLFMESYLEKYNRLMDKDIKGYTEEVIEIFTNYSWPGNISEIENAIEYGVNICRKGQIDIQHLPVQILSVEPEEKEVVDLTLAEQVRAFERERLIDEITKSSGSKATVARKLGLSTATLYRKLQELEINTKTLKY